ncbi:MAG: ROK family protein, partial [Candidatus Promineifilaceae bacterium]|nr:ROK family protein [Candidatus Promineifilaceae bacterium]
RTGKPLVGRGIGVPGLVEISTGTLLVAPNLGWHEVELRKRVQDALQIPTFIANEANMAALGESYFGAGQDIQFMLYVSSGVGIGGGIVANGRLMEGATGFAGEVGHMVVERDGRLCNCGGRGCWETVAGEAALLERVQAVVCENPQSLIARMVNGQADRVTLPILVKAADEGDPLVSDALQETAHWLGIGIASLVNVLNPQRVVFGGPLSIAHAHLLPVVRETVSKQAWHWVQQEANIVTAAYGRDAAVIGGVAMVYRELLNEPRHWLQGTRRK